MPRLLPLLSVLTLSLAACDDPADEALFDLEADAEADADDDVADVEVPPLIQPDDPEALLAATYADIGHEYAAGAGSRTAPVHGTQAPNDNCTQVHSNALDTAMNACGNNYYAMADDGTIPGWHDRCYWPQPVASTGATSAGMINATSWLAGNVQAMPIYKPFRETDVGVGTGWMYNANDKHCGLDYGRGGASFPVRAVADGVVVFAGYMPSPGNVVILEHTRPDGGKFRTIHHHLRDGRDADIARARKTLTHSQVNGFGWENVNNPSTAYIRQYKQDADAAATTLANGATAAQLQAIEQRWGTNAQLLSVDVGETVKAGQQIAWAGTTGFDTGGVHLHVMFARPASVRVPGTLATETRWVFFDPYGLYAGPSNECYQGFAPTGAGSTSRHASVLSPVHAEFPLIGHENFQTIFEYFASKGMAARSLATDSTSGWKVAGAFTPRPVIPVTRFLATFNQHQANYDAWWPNNWMPDQVVGMTAAGGARFTSIFAPRINGTVQSHMMTPAFFAQRFNDLYNSHRLSDVSLYNQDGALYLTGVWKPQAGGGYGMYYGLTRTDLDNMHVTMTNAGTKVVQVVKYNHPGLGDRFAGLWHALQNEAISGPFVDLTADQLMSYRDLYMGVFGMKIKHLSAYKGLYSVIFTSK